MDKEKIKKGGMIAGFALFLAGAIYYVAQPFLSSDNTEAPTATAALDIPDAQTQELLSKREGYAFSLEEKEAHSLLRGTDSLQMIDDLDKSLSELREEQRAVSDDAEGMALAGPMLDARRNVRLMEENIASSRREQELEEELDAIKAQLLEMKRTSSPSPAPAEDPIITGYMNTLQTIMNGEKKDTVPTVKVDRASLPKATPRKVVKETVSFLDNGADEPMMYNSFYQTSLPRQEKEVERNTIFVAVDKTVVVKDGDFVRLRLKEPIWLDGMEIPKNTLFVAQAGVQGTRMELKVRTMEYKGRIVAVKLTAFDVDGQQGINIPNTVERQALKEAGAQVGGSVGTSFTFASGAKDQVISEVARTALQGSAQYLQKKISAVRVQLKAGYRLYLVEEKSIRE